MTRRINVVDDQGKLIGYFDENEAREFYELAEGPDRRSVHTKSTTDHQMLYRTAGGRWVLYHYTDYSLAQPRSEFIDSEREAGPRPDSDAQATTATMDLDDLIELLKACMRESGKDQSEAVHSLVRAGLEPVSEEK